MYVNPFWFGFGFGAVETIIFIVIAAIIYSTTEEIDARFKTGSHGIRT